VQPCPYISQQIVRETEAAQIYLPLSTVQIKNGVLPGMKNAAAKLLQVI